MCRGEKKTQQSTERRQTDRETLSDNEREKKIRMFKHRSNPSKFLWFASNSMVLLGTLVVLNRLIF